MEYVNRVRKICQSRRRRWICMMVLLAMLVLESQIFLLKRGHVMSSVLQTGCREGNPLREDSASRSGETLYGGSHSHKCQSPVLKSLAGGLAPALETATVTNSFPSSKEFHGMGNVTRTADNVGFPVTKLGYGRSKVAHDDSASAPLSLPPVVSYANKPMQEVLIHSKDMGMNATFPVYSTNLGMELPPKSSDVSPVKSSSPSYIDYPAISTDLTMAWKKKDGRQTPISEVKNLSFRSRASTHAMESRWSSPTDQEMLDARREIQNAPTVKNDRELYAPAFWNLSMFKSAASTGFNSMYDWTDQHVTRSLAKIIPK